METDQGTGEAGLVRAEAGEGGAARHQKRQAAGSAGFSAQLSAT